MSDTEEMIRNTGGVVTVELVTAIDALRGCELASGSCAMAMVESGGMVVEVRRALDCADVCAAAHRVLSRGPAPDAAVNAAALVACDASAAACGAHADHHEHCRLHSAGARACADALRALQKVLGG